MGNLEEPTEGSVEERMTEPSATDGSPDTEKPEADSQPLMMGIPTQESVARMIARRRKTGTWPLPLAR